MKKWIILLILIIIYGLCLTYNSEIVNFILDNFTDMKKVTTTLVNNKYASSNSYEYVSLTDDFSPDNKQDIMNIYYTVINSGMDEFTFYCPDTYEDCINDVVYISDNQELLSDINNFVPVFNSFSDIDTEYNTLGKVTIYITHDYTDSEILEIEEKIEEIKNEVITDDMSIEDKIKAIHDYIINNTKYDVDRSDNKVNNYKSDTSYGALIEHYAICGGYADSMKLFLDLFGVDNYKVSSENHVWNLVNIDNTWYHLDLTWDDPVTSTGEDVLEYDFFLITTSELKELKTDQHNFDENVYIEAKELTE